MAALKSLFHWSEQFLKLVCLINIITIIIVIMILMIILILILTTTTIIIIINIDDSELASRGPTVPITLPS